MKFSATLILAGFLTLQAQALPVLTETAGGLTTDIMTLFKDHEDPDLFYFLPTSGSFGKNTDGSPMVSLVTWGLNTVDGGGYFNFVLRGGLAPEVKEAIQIWQLRNPGKKLSVVPIYNSYLAALGQNNDSKENRELSKSWNSLFKAIDIPPHGGVAETELGVNILLTPAGARIMKAQIKKGNAPFNLQLCYSVQGTTPSMNAKITLNYKHIYEKFSAELGGGYWYWNWNVKAVVEKLYQEGAIKIEILGGDAKVEDYLAKMTDILIKTYMTPKLTDSAEESRGAMYSFNYTYKEEKTSATFEMIRRDFIERQYCNGLPMRDLKDYADQIISDAD